MIDKELIRKAAEDIDIFEADLTEEYNRLRVSKHRRLPMWPIWTAACVAGILLVFFFAPRNESSLTQPITLAGTDSISTTIPTTLPKQHPVLALQEAPCHQEKPIRERKQADVPEFEKPAEQALEVDTSMTERNHEIMQQQKEMLLAMEQEFQQFDLHKEIRIRGNRMHDEFINLLEE